MKKKIFSIGLIVILALSSMLMTATPASAGDLAWSAVGGPNPPLSNQLVADVDVANVTVAPNGDIFVVNSDATTGGDIIYKSTTGGYTWTAATVGAGTAVIADIAVSPSYATDGTVFAVVTDGGNSRAYISTNAGTSYAVLGGIIDATAARSIDVAPNYAAGNGEVMVATATDVYIWFKNSVQDWVAAGTTAITAFDAVFSPNFPIDGTRIAVDAANIHTLIGSDADWEDTLATATPIVIAGGAADIATPSDFNASLPQARTLYVADVGTDVYRAAVGSATAAVSLGMVANTPQNIAYSGTGFAGTLFAGMSGSTWVYKTTNPAAIPAANVVWSFNFGAPSGAAPAYVAVANDYASSNIVYAGTAGGAALDNSAFSVSSDGGVYFYQTGLIDTAILGINDFAAASASELYLVTNDAAAVASIWKSVNGGARWNRISSPAATGNTAILRLSPDYATDSTLFYGDVGVAGAGAISMSNDSGNTWVLRSAPVAVGDIAVKDMYTFYVGSSAAGTVQSTANGGWTWQPAATLVNALATAVTDLEVDLATGHILAGCDNGAVGISTNNNATPYTALGAGIGGLGALVDFDANYADNSIVYAADASGASNIFRFGVGSYTAWLALGWTVPNPVPPPATLPYFFTAGDILVAPDGTLYVSDVAGAAGIHRSINPTAGLPTVSAAEWNSLAIALAPGGCTLVGLDMVEGSNVIYAVDAANLRIVTYTDTLSTATAVVTAPDEGAQINPALVSVTVESVPGALGYQVQWNLRPDYLGTGAVVAIAWPATTTGPMAAIPAGATIYYRARVSAPLLGPWCETRTLETHLAAAPSTAPAIQAGGEGSTGVGGWDVNTHPTFQWGAIAAATGYEFQLATDAGMTDLIVDATGANALGVVTAYQPAVTLDYDTAYFWRVRAFNDTTITDWSNVTAFTTMAEPEPEQTAAPPEITVQPPDITVVPPAITVEPPVITVEPAEAAEAIAPGYLWAVIIIGAVLVIALIVLIVRTRRTV